MSPEQIKAVMDNVEVTGEHEEMLGWEPRMEPMERYDGMLATMVDCNQQYGIPFRILRVGRLLQLWEKTDHQTFWDLGDATVRRVLQKSRPASQGETNNPQMSKKAPTPPLADTAERKELLSKITDPESYLPIITACMEGTEAVKRLRPHHMANTLALLADLFLSNYDSLSLAFERNFSLEIAFKAKLAQEKDTVEIQFKPIEVYKDSASLGVPPEGQEEFPFVKKGATPMPPAPAAGSVVDAEVLPALPAPVEPLGLPAPLPDDEIPYQETKAPATPVEVRTPEEQKAYDQGYAAFVEDGNCYSANPYDEEDEVGLPLHDEFASGWSARAREVTYGVQAEKLLKATKGSFLTVLAKVSNGFTAVQLVSIIKRALIAEKDGKNRDWMIVLLDDCLANTDAQ